MRIAVQSRLVLAAMMFTVAASLADAQTAARPDPEFLAPLDATRARGCAGQPGTAAPLRWTSMLGAAAARAASGTPVADALAGVGYRSMRVFRMTVRGARSPAAAGQALAQRYCEPLTQSALSEAGFYREGDGYWVLLAEPFNPPAPGQASAIAARVLALVNDLRAKPRRCGDRSFDAAPPLRYNAELEQAASAHAQDMAQNSTMSHEGRDGSSFSERVTRSGYRWRAVGENVAAGQASPERVVNDWAQSPGHCANLMNPRFTDMGVAYAVNPGSTERIYWAQSLGRPRLVP